MIGEAHPRLGGERFVAGTGRFVDDVRVPGMLHAAVLRSPHAHARLVSIDTKRARDLPGRAPPGRLRALSRAARANGARRRGLPPIRSPGHARRGPGEARAGAPQALAVAARPRAGRGRGGADRRHPSRAATRRLRRHQGRHEPRRLPGRAGGREDHPRWSGREALRRAALLGRSPGPVQPLARFRG